jgi:hypothetical protein
MVCAQLYCERKLRMRPIKDLIIKTPAVFLVGFAGFVKLIDLIQALELLIFG